MNPYQPRTDDMAFILANVLQAPAQLQALGAFAEVDPDLMRQVLDEAGKFVGEVIAPLNRDGDEIGARFEAGSVTMAPGFSGRLPGLLAGRLAGAGLRSGRRRPGPAGGAGGHAVRNAQRRQPWLDHGARPSARRLRVPETPRQRRAQGALPREDRHPANGWPPCA
jgi:hypothetical protein